MESMCLHTVVVVDVIGQREGRSFSPRLGAVVMRDGLAAATRQVRGRTEHAVPDGCDDASRLLRADPSC